MTPDLLVFPIMSGSARQCGIAAVGVGEVTVTLTRLKLDDQVPDDAWCGIAAVGVGEATVMLTRLKLNDQVPNDAWLGDPVFSRHWLFVEGPIRDPDLAGGGRP